MDAKQKLLVLDRAQAPDGQPHALRLLRARALTELAQAGGRVIHDSGGLMLVVELPEAAEAALSSTLPGARLGALEPEIDRMAEPPDPNERLFLEALRIRTSSAYREAKRRQVPGESPEERLLFTGSCVREEY